MVVPLVPVPVPCIMNGWSSSLIRGVCTAFTQHCTAQHCPAHYAAALGAQVKMVVQPVRQPPSQGVGMRGMDQGPMQLFSPTIERSNGRSDGSQGGRGGGHLPFGSSAHSPHTPPETILRLCPME